MIVASLFAAKVQGSIVFPKSFKVALNAAIAGREAVAVHYELKSQENAAYRKDHEGHMYYIDALKYIRSMTQHLFEGAAPVTSQTNLAATVIPTWPAQLTSQESEAIHAELHELVYDYAEKMSAIQRFLQEVWTQYVAKKIRLRTVYGVLYTAVPLIEDMSAELYESEPDFDPRSQDDRLKQFWARGVAGLLHFDHENEAVKAGQANRLVSRAMQGQLAHLGLTKFFSPAVAKWLLYWQEKYSPTGKQPYRYTGRLERPARFGTPVISENGQNLTQKSDPSLYT